VSRNPFGDEPIGSPKRVNPFGEEQGEGGVEEAAARLEHAARKIRQLRTQLGAEGLTLSATRELIDELSGALDAAARGLRDVNGPS
jgi:flagellin-like hook-associated protein FlgL